MIKYNVKTINDWLYNSNPIKKLYYNGMVRYRRFVANGQPTPPSFDGKWKATYQDGHVESAQCDSSSEIISYEINKTNLVSVEIGDCVTRIGIEAFKNCTSLTSVTIGSGVTSIGESAFDNCTSLTSCTIGSGVTSIGYYAFQRCTSLTSIEIPNSVIWINDSAFYYCTSLTSVTIPNSVTSISDYAFQRCTSLTSIEIPSSVTSIGLGAFDGTPWWDTYSADTSHHYGNIIYINDVAYKATSTSITTAAFKSGTVSIGNSAFRNCRSLTSITIPSSVTRIGYRAFQDCYRLTSVTVNAVVPPTIGGNWCFYGSSCPIYVPSESVNAYKSADGWRDYASRIQPIS